MSPFYRRYVKVLSQFSQFYRWYSIVLPQKDGAQHDEAFDKYLVERDRATDLEHKANKLELTIKELEMELDKTRELFGRMHYHWLGGRIE